MYDWRLCCDLNIKRYLLDQTDDVSEFGNFAKLMFLWCMKNIEYCFIMDRIRPVLNEHMALANEWLNEYSVYLRIYRGYPKFDTSRLNHQDFYGPVRSVELEEEISDILHMFVRGCDLSKSALEKLTYNFYKLRSEIKLYTYVDKPTW